MPFVARAEDGSIYGCWTVRQYDGQEELPENNAELVSFRALRSPVDQSDLNNLNRQIKALALCIADLHTLTPMQMRTLFKQKYDSLS